MPLPKTTDTGSIADQNSIDSHHTQETNDFIHHFVRSDLESTCRVQQKIGSAVEYWSAVEKNAAQWKC